MEIIALLIVQQKVYYFLNLKIKNRNINKLGAVNNDSDINNYKCDFVVTNCLKLSNFHCL